MRVATYRKNRSPEKVQKDRESARMGMSAYRKKRSPEQVQRDRERDRLRKQKAKEKVIVEDVEENSDSEGDQDDITHEGYEYRDIESESQVSDNEEQLQKSRHHVKLSKRTSREEVIVEDVLEDSDSEGDRDDDIHEHMEDEDIDDNSNVSDNQDDDLLSMSSVSDNEEDNLLPFTEAAMFAARAHLHRTVVGGDPSVHQAHVCIVCDCFIPSCEKQLKMTHRQLKKHSKTLGVAEYERHHKVKLKDELKKQYHVHGFPNMLLSRRSKKIKNGWLTCASCHKSLSKKNTKSKRTGTDKDKVSNPPKYAIANGFVIGEFPDVITRRTRLPNVDNRRKVDPEKLTDEMKAILAPTRPYGYVFAYTAGHQQSIKGHFSFFETDQSRVGAVVDHMQNKLGIAENMFVMLCGRFTPRQREIVRKRTEFDSDEYFDILNWFISESGHPGYSNLPVPEKFPKPTFIEDKPTQNNTDDPVNEAMESKFQGGSYFFSSAQEPSERTSVYDDSEAFATAIMNQNTPTLLTIGGEYVKQKELRIENILPFAFPYGMGGPTQKVKRRTQISQEECLRRYLRLSMKQFMTGDVALIIYQMYSRIISFRSGVMVCRSEVNGVPFGERLAQFTSSDVPLDGTSNEFTNMLLKAINTSCRAMGHTPEAAKAARKCYFSYMDHYGLNSIFLTVTPDDLRNFRIRLYVNAGRKVSPYTFSWKGNNLFFLFFFSYYS